MFKSNLTQEQIKEVLNQADALEEYYGEPEVLDEDTNIIWQPQEGSQVWFLSCTCFEALLTGPRGTGKTDVLIMDFARDCGIGWGSYWRGIIFRETYKQLSDVIVKTRRWFPRIFPGITFNKSSLTWNWATGESLMLSYINGPEDYNTYHGWEIPWCVKYDTLVKMADGSKKQIQDINIGEQVMTLEGPKPVLKVMHSLKKAVEVSFFDDDARLLGSQIQGEEHRILSAAGMYTNSEGEYNLIPYGNNDEALVLKLNNNIIKENFDYYSHPYSGEIREVYLNFYSRLSKRNYKSVDGEVHLVDLTVADASHYITELNTSKLLNSSDDSYRYVINRNCGFEEMTNWPTSEAYEAMKTCCRSSCPIEINGRKIPKRIRATTNPYGKGHTWVKKYFINISEELVPYVNPNGQDRVWINSTLFENKKLIEADPDYIKVLSSITDPNKRKAWFEGSWDIVAGGILGDLWDHKTHVLEPFDIPLSWKIDRAFDWGSSSPFAVGWFAESDGSEVRLRDGRLRYFPKGSLVMIHEWYGWTGEDNEGLYMPANEVAKKIIEIERTYSLLKDRRVLPGPADNSIFSSTDGDSNTVAKRMKNLFDGKTPVKGISWKRSIKSPGSRVMGLELLRSMVAESLKPYPEEPCFYVFNTCREGFLRTVPSIPRDEKNPDDAYSGGEDHSYDMVRYRVLSRTACGERHEI